MTQDMPTPPSRLFDDRRLLNHDLPADWERRRSNKMRERFAANNRESVRGLSLIAPVQPSNATYLQRGGYMLECPL